MRRSVVALSAFWVLIASPAWAQESTTAQIEALRRMVEEALKQNEELRKRVRELEEAVSKQAPAPAKEPTKEAAQEAPKEPAAAAAPEAPKEPAAAAAEVLSAAKGPFGKIQLGGALEVEAFTKRDLSGKRKSEFQLTTAEFDFEAKILDWAKAEAAFEWDRDRDTVTLNEAFITLATADFPAYLKAGRGVAPYGIATGSTVAAKLEDSLTLAGPLTTEIFELKTDYALVAFKKWGLQVGGYLFNGTTNNVPGGGKQLNHYGFAASYSVKTDPVSLVVGANWVSSVYDLTGLVSAFPEFQEPGRNYVPGYSVHAKLGLWGFSLIAEYDTAIRNKRLCRPCGPTPDHPDTPYTVYNVQPEAWQIELGYTTEVFFDTKMYLAVNYSTTASLLGSDPKQRLLGTIGVWLANNLRVAAEYGAEKGYSKIQLGTGAHGESWRVRLTYEW